MKIDKIVEETLFNLKCLNCLHQKLCLGRLGGINLQMHAENCEDFLDIKYLPPVKGGDKIYFIRKNFITDKKEIVMGHVTNVDFHDSAVHESWWTITFTYLNDFLEFEHDTQKWGFHTFYKTKEEAKERL